MSDLGKQCPHCMGLIGYTHRSTCPVAEAERKYGTEQVLRHYEKYARTFIDQTIDDVDFYRASNPGTCAHASDWMHAGLTPEQRFDALCTESDRVFLAELNKAFEVRQ